MVQTPFYVFAWIASITFGLEAIIGKFTSKYSISNPWLFNFLWSLGILVFTIPFALWNNVEIPSHWKNLLLASIFSALAGVLYILLLYKLDVSVLAPLFNFRTVFAVVLSIFFLREILTTNQYILIGVIFISGMFLTIDEKFTLRSFFRPVIALAMAEMVILAVMAVFINKSVAENGYWETTLWSNILIQLLLLFTFPFFKRDINRISVRQIGPSILMAAAGVIGVLAANKAYAANVSISTAIVSIPFSMIMAFLFSVFAPKLLEKHTLKVYAIRFIATAIIIIAALKLS